MKCKDIPEDGRPMMTKPQIFNVIYPEDVSPMHLDYTSGIHNARKGDVKSPRNIRIKPAHSNEWYVTVEIKFHKKQFEEYQLQYTEDFPLNLDIQCIFVSEIISCCQGNLLSPLIK